MKTTKTIAEILAADAMAFKYEDLPKEVIHRVKRTLIDTLGCGFGGYLSEPSKKARIVAGTISSSQPATVMGSGQKTAADLATFANDVMIRYLDFNDGYIGEGGGHPSDSIPPLLAAAEVAHAGGRELIAATVLAYEVYGRFFDVIDLRPLGIDHSTLGGLASLVGAARLLGLSEQQIVQAINIYVASNVTLGQSRTGNISEWKACAYANASKNAIFAAQLAQCGMTGPSSVFEGRKGFFNIVSRKAFQLAPMGGKDGEPFRIMRCHTKCFPLGNFSQSVVTAVLKARALIRDNFRDVTELHIHVSQKGVDIMASDPDKWRPTTRETADHSIPYTAGVALMYGTVATTHFGEEYLRNKELLDLISRIKVSASEKANRRVAETYVCDVDVTLRSGESKSANVEYHLGHPLNPMSDSDIEKKFRSLTTGLLSSDQINGLLGRLWSLEDLESIETLMQMTCVSSE